MLVWVVLTEIIRFTSEGNVIDKSVGPAAVHKSFEEALKHAEELNDKLIETETKHVVIPTGEILWTDNYVHKTPVYLK